MSNLPGPQSRRDWQAIGAASGLGCSIVVSLLLCIGGGILIDRWLGIQPVGVLVGVALGLVLAGYQMYELATIGVSDRSGGKTKPTPDDEDGGESDSA